MYARLSSYQFDPSRIDEMVSNLDKIKIQVAEIAGLVDIYSAWRADGNGITIAVYEDQQAAEAAAPMAQAIWADLADLLTGPPNVQVYEFVEDLSS